MAFEVTYCPSQTLDNVARFFHIWFGANITPFLMPDYVTICTEFLKLCLLSLQSGDDVSLQLHHSWFQSCIDQLFKSPIPANHAGHSVSLKQPPPKTSFQADVEKSLFSIYMIWSVLKNYIDRINSWFLHWLPENDISYSSADTPTPNWIEILLDLMNLYITSLYIHIYVWNLPPEWILMSSKVLPIK